MREPLPAGWDRLLRVAALLAPSSARARWRREWTGELCFARAAGRSQRAFWRLLWCWVDALALWQQEISMTGWTTDILATLRSARRTPALVLTITATLAVGVGLTTAMFSVVDTVLLRRLPVPDDHRLVRFWQDRPASGLADWPFSYRMYQEVSATIQAADVAAFSGGQFNVLVGGQAVRVSGSRVSDTFFPVTGLPLALGRSFSRAEEAAGENLVVVGHQFWRDYLGADPDAVGRPLSIGVTPYQIVGVAAPGADLVGMVNARLGAPGGRVDLYLPLQPFGSMQADTTSTLQMVGRLREDASVEDARAQVFAVIAPFLQSRGSDGWLTGASTLPDYLVGSSRRPLLVLFAAVVALLLMMCASLGGLVLVRSVGRRDEWTTRRLLGATPLRILRQVITEYGALAAVGATLGLGMAAWLVAVVRTWAPVALPRVAELGVDWRGAAFACAIATLAAVLFGLAPAGLATQWSQPLATGPRHTLSRQTRLALRAMVGLQMTVAMVLTAGSAVLVRSLSHLLAQDPGYSADGVASAAVALPTERYNTDADVRQFAAAVVARLGARPDVDHVAVTSITLPTQGPRIRFQRADVAGEDGAGAALQSAVSPGFFDTLGIQLVAGRPFTDADDAGAPGVAIITQALADRYWPDESPVGRSILVGSWRTFGTTGASTTPAPREIVGVTTNLTDVGVNPGPPVEMLFAPFDQDPWATHGYLIRTSAAPLDMVAPLRQAVSDVDARQPVFQTGHLLDELREGIVREQTSARILALFASMALVVAALGTYGVVAYAVLLRRREIGLRMALGATPGAVLQLVAREGLAPVVVGVATGVGVATLAVGALRGLLYEIQPLDPVSFAVAIVILAVLGGAAAILPARRSARLDAWSVLRTD